MGVVQSVLDGSVDISSLIISKSLSKEAKDYTSTAPHVTLTRKLQKRDLHTAPRMGDRVPFVIVARGDKSVKKHEKAEDPLYVIQHDLQIDREYYLMNQLRNPVERILEPLIPGITERLFSTAPCTVYLPPSVALRAKRLTTARVSTGSTESRLAMLASAGASAAAQSPAPPPPPPQPPKKKAAAKKAGKLLPGQCGLFTGENGKPEVLVPLEEGGPTRKSWAKAPPKKPKAHIAGQTTVLDQKTYVKAPERDITKPKEGYIAVNIRYRIAAATPVVSKESIARFGMIMPKCLACRVMITPDSLTEQELTRDVVVPVCKPCREAWRAAGRSEVAEISRLRGEYQALADEAAAKFKHHWDICAKCPAIKSVEEIELCMAKDCPNFYPRTAAKSKVSKFDNTMRRLKSVCGCSCACGGGGADCGMIEAAKQ